MADLDYGGLTVHPGNYDEYMLAATQARERLLADNAKKKHKLVNYNPLLAALVLMHQSLVKPLRVQNKLKNSINRS